MTKWTQFWDMHSGGGQKEAFAHCYIEAPAAEARSVFYSRFGHAAERVSCTCCGEDYSISESESLEQATAYHRGLRYVDDIPGENGLYRGAGWVPGYYLEPGAEIPAGCTVRRAGGLWGENRERYPNGMSLEEYLASAGDAVRIIRADEIKPEERAVNVPEQGYVWQD